MASPVDWSEFHTWTYLAADVQKCKMKSAVRRSQKQAGTAAPSLAASGTVCPSCVVERLGKTRGGARALLGAPGRGVSTAHNAYAQFAAGAVGGGTATYTTHWLDTIKVKMQTFPHVYNSGASCLRLTLREEGLRGLYQGASPAVVGQTSKAAVVFMSYGLCEEMVCRLAGRERTDDLSVWQHASAGAMTGVVASFLLCPLELVKCRLQALHAHPSSGAVCRSPAAMAFGILRSEGLRGLYRALPGIWAKEIPGSFIYFGSYEMAKAAVKHATKTEHLSSGQVFMSGVFAGLCFCITHPLETVKTRVQVMSAVSETKGFFRAFVHFVKTEGFRPLCNGLKPSMLRACAYSGIQFLVYESVKDYFLDEQCHEKDT